MDSASLYLDVLEAQFLQLVPPDKLALETLRRPVNADKQQQLFERLFAPNAQKYPPPAAYTIKVLKYLISQLQADLQDDDDNEINENILNLYTELLSAPKESAIVAATIPSYVTYMMPSSINTTEARLTLLEQRNVLVTHGHTGARTWEAAFALGEYLVSMQQKSQEQHSFMFGKSVIEIGAGTGFVSFVAAKLGASRVLSTDGDSEVCQNIAKNLSLNQDIADKISIQKLVWGEDCDNIGQSWDLIVGADVTYDTRVIPDLVSTVHTLLAGNEGSVAIIAATSRNKETLDFWEVECGKWRSRFSALC